MKCYCLIFLTGLQTLLEFPAPLNPHPPAAPPAHTPLLILQSTPASLSRQYTIHAHRHSSCIVCQSVSCQPANTATHLLLVGSFTFSTYTSQFTIVVCQIVVIAPAGLSPFQVHFGYQPPLFPSQEEETFVPSAQAFIRRCNWIWQQARAQLLPSSAHQKEQANCHHSATPITGWDKGSGCHPGTCPSGLSPES